MKKILDPIISIMLLMIVQFAFAQKEQDNSFVLESGINLSLPVHIQMYRSHRLGIGVNLRAAEKITSTTEFGVRAEYDYRFTKKNHPDVPPESTVKERALYKNFNLFCIKPNIQFNLNSNWCLGAESGVGYAISDEDPKIGLGFVSEFNGPTRFGSCSGIYLGKYFPMNISLNLTNFVAHGHAENTLGLKFNYYFYK
nr:hypothetical protein [uncultured Flavobacterium sp.]